MLHGKEGSGTCLGNSSCSMEMFSPTSQLTRFSWSRLCFTSSDAFLNVWLHSSHRYPASGAKTDLKHNVGIFACRFEVPFDSWGHTHALFGIDVACNWISPSAASVNVSSSYKTETQNSWLQRNVVCLMLLYHWWKHGRHPENKVSQTAKLLLLPLVLGKMTVFVFPSSNQRTDHPEENLFLLHYSLSLCNGVFFYNHKSCTNTSEKSSFENTRFHTCLSDLHCEVMTWLHLLSVFIWSLGGRVRLSRTICISALVYWCFTKDTGIN